MKKHEQPKSKLEEVKSAITEKKAQDREKIRMRYEATKMKLEDERTRFFKENCIEDEEKISCTTVIDELSTSRIFTMTFVDGVTLAKKDMQFIIDMISSLIKGDGEVRHYD